MATNDLPDNRRNHETDQDHENPHEGLTVEVNNDGFVTNVRVSNDIQDSIAPADFARALHESYLAAARKAVGTRFPARRQEGADNASIPPPTSGNPSGNQPTDPETRIRERHATFQRIREKARALERIQPRDDHRISSPYGALVLEYRGYLLLRLECDASRVERFGARRLEDEAMSLFTRWREHIEEEEQAGGK